ncbi:MAG: DUF819 family protein [Chitinophagales bacterium]
MAVIVQLFTIFLGPYIGIRLFRLFPTIKWLSPVVWSYALGIILVNIHLFSIDTQIATIISQVAVLLAIPMLLYATDLIAWFKHARNTVLSFGLCVIAGTISSALMAFVFHDFVKDTWQLSAMLVGVYTGGTPNLNAIGLALKAEESTFVLLNAADTVCGAVYILFLSSFAPTLLARFFPKFQLPKNTSSENTPIQPNNQPHSQIPTLLSFLQCFGLTSLIIAASVGTTYWVSGELENIVLIILLLTTFSVSASLLPVVRCIKGSFEIGEYLLLIFCVAIGMLADFSKLIEEGGTVLLFTASVMGLAILLHYGLALLFRIDRDTVMITSTAAIYGPVFVGQIASVINNKSLVFSGMATGLVGYAIGNYLGIGLGYWLKWCMG